MAGALVISLDFELFWGVRDKRRLATERSNLMGARRVVPLILDRFGAQAVRATWATVGLLFFRAKSEMVLGLPSAMPQYVNAGLSPYTAIAEIGADEAADPCHFAASLIAQIRSRPGQEIGTHTFSHYYALEAGQTEDAFRADLLAASRIAEERGVSLRSLVFPRNQCNPLYLPACAALGLTSYRGNEEGWMNSARRSAGHRPWTRAARLADAYVNLSGHHTVPIARVAASGSPFNIPASRFLRPWSRRLRWLEPARLRRITRAMTHAARRDEIFHLWWHPENFGTDIDENLAVLDRILSHFAQLRRAYGMESLNMGDVAERVAAGTAAAAPPLRERNQQSQAAPLSTVPQF